MIFYFTGTGNSLYAAKYLLMPDETLVNIAEARKEGKYHYSLQEGERVGFVFPTYCYTLGYAVTDFLDRLKLTGAGYVFGVITCGAGMGGAGAYLKKRLDARGIRMDNLFQVVMTDNTVFYWDVDDKETARATLTKAKERLAEIKRAVEAKETHKIGGSLLTPFYRAMYRLLTKTKPFRVDEKCVHCGKCAKECPEDAITMKDGVPTWTKDRCTKCSACINRCPVQAIQYGKGTEKRRRYTCPE